MKEQLRAFEERPAEIVFNWHDPLTEAKGWVVINSLRGGAAGGGTRMRKGLTESEVLSLAKTMEIKFTVAGPAIGGAKSGIDFDPNDPERRRVAPLVQSRISFIEKLLRYRWRFERRPEKGSDPNYKRVGHPTPARGCAERPLPAWRFCQSKKDQTAAGRSQLSVTSEELLPKAQIL